jgi:uncharacterized protein YkwD
MKRLCQVLSAGFLVAGAFAKLPSVGLALHLPCKPEDALSETAAEILLSGRRVEARDLLPLARQRGFDGVALHAHEGLDDAALSLWLKGLADRADGPLVCGEALGEQRRVVVVAERVGQLSEAQGTVRGRLAPGFRRPELIVEALDGQTERFAVTAEALAAGVPLKGELLPYAKVQLLAEGPHGPRPVAELVAASELGAPGSPSIQAQDSQATGEELRRGPRARPLEALVARVDGTRREEGAKPLRGNQLLHGSAQRHARRVCELGRVAHQLGEGDNPETRLREEHIEARAVGEAIARAASVDAALAAMFRSPSHRLAVTDKRFTDVGIGQAFDAKGHSCVVVLLAAWPRRTP